MWMKTKKFQRNMKKFGKVLKKEIETINGGEKIEYRKDLKKISFESNDDLPLNKPIKLRLFTIIIRSAFSEDYYDVNVNKYGVKCEASLKFWESKGWINEIDPYGWF